MIIGHKKQWELLEKVAANGRLPQAMIFCGDDSLGKKKIAFQFIKLINCSGENKPCGDCLSCRLIEKQNHPDLIIVVPEGKEIQIDQVRDLAKQLSLRPQFFSQKAVIIDDAHTLNSRAQNCLLKTLEEPPGSAIFTLLTSLPELLLSTIRSRCEILKFYPVPPKQMEEGFKEKKKHPSFKKIIAQSHGMPGRVVAFFENKEHFPEKEKRLKTIQILLEGDLIARFAFAQTFFNKETAPQAVQVFLDDLIRYLRDLLLKKIAVQKAALPRKDQDGYSPKKLKEILTLACDLKFLLQDTNINQRLAFENFILNL